VGDAVAAAFGERFGLEMMVDELAFVREEAAVGR
jgi:hypothetical protein